MAAWTYLQTGHKPELGFFQLANRHSLHKRWAHGVNTASSNASRHIGHSPCSPLRNSSTTSWMYAREGTFLPSVSWASWPPLRKRFASLFRSEYSCVSPRLACKSNHHQQYSYAFLEIKMWKEMCHSSHRKWLYGHAVSCTVGQF